MKNYTNFINENLNQQYVHISNKLKQILLNMDNKFAKLILKTQDDNNGLRNIFADYIDYNDSDGMFTFLYNNSEISSDPYNQRGRSSIKPTKILSKIVIDQDKYLIENNITQRDIELFSNDIKPKTDQLVEWKGEDILKAYNYTGLIKRGKFSASCANFGQKNLGTTWEEPKKEWYDVYIKNPNNISVLVVLDTNGDVVGRRMFFKGEQFEDSGNLKKGQHVGIGGNFYGQGGTYSKYDTIITKWLTDNGYKHFDNRMGSNNIMIQLENYKFPHFPPFDSFNINLDNGVISYPNYPRSGGNWDSCYKLMQRL